MKPSHFHIATHALNYLILPVKRDADIKCMYNNMQFLNQEISKIMQMPPVPCDTVIKISRRMVSHARLHEMA